MSSAPYSAELCCELHRLVREANMKVRWVPPRHEEGDLLDLEFTGVWPETTGRARFRMEAFVGGGFAGQVYKCRLEGIEPGNGGTAPLTVGQTYALKILVPPSRFSVMFRNLVYSLGFQAPFSSQHLASACRYGLLWQKLIGIAMGAKYGLPDSVPEPHASFYDPKLRAWGEIQEWVEGRTWRLEPDTSLKKRRRWRELAPRDTGSPEFVAKRQFMSALVDLLHDMGAVELARQYEWWTLKSQPNVLKRRESDSDPSSGLCAVDFRAGLALLPFVPMSPADVRLILAGMRRGSLVQFDRCDFARLQAFADRHPQWMGGHRAMIGQLIEYGGAYRRAVPDIAHQGFRLLVSADLRRSVRSGLTEAYLSAGLLDRGFAEMLRESPLRFCVFHFFGAVPVLGRLLREVWGRAAFRAHVGLICSSPDYFRRWARAGIARRLIRWHRGGRAGEARVRYLLDHPPMFWAQRLTIGFLPAGVHRAIAEPAYLLARLRGAWRFVRNFYANAAFREKWLTALIRDGYEDGMLDLEERDEILARVKDPYIVKYLKSVAVHFATLPLTQIVSVIVGITAALWIWLAAGQEERDVASAVAAFGVVILAFQIMLISPGSIARGLYVLYLVRRDRDFRSYAIAAPLSFVKYIGYLAFPMQMLTVYPALSRFMASRWATQAVHIVPVFGEKGALLEHFVFDAFFNVPMAFGRWASKRVRGVLDIWLMAGLLVLGIVFPCCGVEWTSRGGLNIVLAVTVIFILPRVLFYPVMTRRKRAEARGTNGGVDRPA